MRPRPATLPVVLALGLLAGGGAIALRGAVHRAAALRRLGEASEEEVRLATWAAAEAIDATNVPATLLGLAAAALVWATRRRPALQLGAALVGGALLAAVAGGALDAPATRAAWRLVPAVDTAWVLALLGVVAVGSIALATRGARALPPALALALLAVLPPLATRVAFAATAPTFTLRQASLDLLAREDLWRVVAAPEGFRPSLRVITPAVSSHSDSADKPALWMAPPCEVEVTLPADHPPGVLRVSAGIDRVARQSLPEGVGDLTVDFEVRVNGARAFAARIYNGRPQAGQWDSPDWTWRHAEGGIPVAGGDTLLLRTRLPEGHPAAAMPPEQLVVGLGGLVVEAAVEVERERARPDAPNLVLVVQDTLRADRCSTYGYGRDTTPHLDALAARGLTFDAALTTSSWTWPSTASFLTGLPPDAHGVVSNESCTLNLSLDTVAEALQRRGFTTAAWSCNPLIVPARYFDQGFEAFDFHGSEFRKTDEVWPAVSRWLDAHAGARFFLYLHLADPHTPHRPDPRDLEHLGAARPATWPERGLDAFGSRVRRDGTEAVTDAERAYVRDLYDASVRTGDRWLGTLQERLDALGVLDETVIVFTADHGEELLDRGDVGHGHDVHAELVRAPLVIAGPGVPAGERAAAVVSNRHVAPTLALLGGAELPGMGDAAWLLQPAGEDAMFATTKGRVGGRGYQHLLGLRRGDLVLHWWREGDEVDLYDVAADPDERVDLAAQRPDDAAALRDELLRRLEAQRAWAPRHKVGVGEAGLEMLQGIGYLGDDDDGDRDDAE